jgi:regulation of enolase protein 1 (concanavalin A-like superfamily)
LAGSSPAPGEIDITWTAPAGATSYSVLRSSNNGGTWTTVGSNVLAASFQDTTVAAGTSYQYQVIAADSGGSSEASAPFAISSAAAPAFSSADIGAPLAGGTNTLTDDSAYDVTAGGTGIYGNADSFRFVYRQVTGDFDIAVQVTNLTIGVAGTYPQAGLLARATLDAASPDVGITASPVGGYRFKHRDSSGAATTQTQTSNVNATFPNVWLRMKRAGNVFTTYYSADGVTWTTMGTVTLTTLPASTPIYIGMAVASNTNSATSTASFRNFTGA